MNFAVIVLLAQAVNAAAAVVPTVEANAPKRSDDEGIAAYCRYVDAVADSERALLLAPSIVSQDGILRATASQAVVVNQKLLEPHLRASVGLQYSIAKLRQGLLLRDQARAECERYRALSTLTAFAETNKEGVSRRALLAKVAVYEKSIPHALEILSAKRAAVEQSRATIDDVNATQLRIEMMRNAISDAKEQMARLPEASPDGSISLEELMQRHIRAEAQVESIEASLRGVQGWDISINGGYENIWHLRESVPVYGELLLSFNLGMLFKSGADERAVESRKAWTMRQSDGAYERVNQTLMKLRGLLETQEAGLKDATALRAEIEARLKRVVYMDADRAKRFTDDLWFELVRVVATQEYLSTQVEDLKTILEGAPKTGAPEEGS